MNSIEDIISLHNSDGSLEDTYVNICFDEKVLKLNTYTLTFTSNNAEKGETRIWNQAVNEEIRKDRKLYREIKEYRVLFEVLRKLRIKTGTIQKMERPDFVLTREDKTYGIEITQIYSGNDWAVEKMREDIKNYGLEGKEIEGFIEYKKYHNKINTYKIKENLVIKAQNDPNKKEEFQVKIKNKIFEKVRKMFDEYQSYDVNIVVAKVVSPEYFDDLIDVNSFGKELAFFVSHLEADNTQKEYMVLIKAGKKFFLFNLSTNEYHII